MTTIAIRMYNVGFGDCFLVTLTDGDERWRMLVDCGVHNSGIRRHERDFVPDIIADLGDEPHLDVVVATHYHTDHIIGFSRGEWDQVTVDEVWLPWVEDPENPDAAALRDRTDRDAQRLTDFATSRLAAANDDEALATSRALADNARTKSQARDRLLGATNGFVDPDNVRFLPDADDAVTTIDLPCNATAQIIGPPRDVKRLRRMNPPRAQHWLTGLGFIGDYALEQIDTIFADYVIDERVLAESDRHQPLLEKQSALYGLRELSSANILAAASRLERWCNNTSLFFVLEVAGKRLVFPGDAQQGAWDHVFATAPELITNADFYKVSHHGSHNGTPRKFVEDGHAHRPDQMAALPYGDVPQWDKIPKTTLIEALAERYTIVRSDQPDANSVHGPNHNWLEIAL